MKTYGFKFLPIIIPNNDNFKSKNNLIRILPPLLMTMPGGGPPATPGGIGLRPGAPRVWFMFTAFT